MEYAPVCLVIPVYNEEANLPQLIDEIEQVMNQQPRSWQALFVDDGSFDSSVSVLRQLASGKPWLHFLALAQNCGQSAAFTAGFLEAKADCFVTLDADLQNDPADIPAMLDLFDTGPDMVIGWRVTRKDSPVKRYASVIANAIRNRLSHETVRDTGCSLKVLRADMAKKLPMFTGMHRFLPTLMKMQGAIVVECPVRHRPRLYGVSKYGIWDRAFSSLYDLLAVRWMQKRAFRYTIKEKG